MAEITLEHIVEEIKTLDAEAQEQLRAFLETLLVPGEVEAKRKKTLSQALRAAGLVTQARQPRAVDTPSRRRIDVQGKPVSETIIEERR